MNWPNSKVSIIRFLSVKLNNFADALDNEELEETPLLSEEEETEEMVQTDQSITQESAI